MKIIMRAAAIQQGMPKYFTGIPCKRGHLSERNTASGTCLECRKLMAAQWYAENTKRAKATRADWRIKNAEKDRADVAESLRQLAEASRKEPGCVSYIPHQVEGEPATVLIYEQYRDPEALEAHRQSAHFKQYAVGGLYQKMRERSLENLVALV